MLVREDGIPRGVRTRRVRVIDYYTTPWSEDPAGTPRAVMFVSRELATGREHLFAWHLLAECRGIPPSQIRRHRADLEAELLREVTRHMQQEPKAHWVHWGLNKVEYGFPALTQRGRALGLGDLAFPSARLVDLAELLKWQFGPDYVGHPRLPNLLRLNRLEHRPLLDPTELAAAFHAGEYRRMLHALQSKVKGIAQVLERHLANQLVTDTPNAKPLALPNVKHLRWIATIRAALATGTRLGHEDGGERGVRAVPGQTVPAEGTPVERPPLIPTEKQRQILELLEGKAFTLDTLAFKLETDRSSLCRRELKELKAKGWVKNDRRVGGYYRPDAPPSEFAPYLTEQLPQDKPSATEVPPKCHRSATEVPPKSRRSATKTPPSKVA